MGNIRKRYNGAFKARVALEAVKAEKTISEISSEYGVHPGQVRQWRNQLLKELPSIFTDRKKKAEIERDNLEAELYRQIGQLKVELDWLKKNLRYSTSEKRRMIEPMNEEIPIYRQCELLELSRSSYYYTSAGESEYNLELMRLIDEQYTRTPFYGTRKMTVWLRRQGYKVNRKRVQRLMRLMGIEAIYPKKRLSISSNENKKYPYLLKGLSIKEPDHVWSTEITYIRMSRGFLYLVAIIDWYSRYVLSWELSNTLDTEFCLKALERALRVSKPEIFNSDQGSQFRSKEFTGRLEDVGIQISMDGRGRVFDNIFIERLWRSLKYEEVYLHSYETVREAKESIGRYFSFYNTERLHESLGYRTPEEIYQSTDETINKQAGEIHL